MTKTSPLFNNFPARAVIAATAAGLITGCSHPLLNSNKDVEVMPFTNQEVASQDLPADNDLDSAKDVESIPDPHPHKAKHAKRGHVAHHKAAKKPSRSSAIVAHTKAKKAKEESKTETTQAVAQVDESNTPKPPPMDMLNAHEDKASAIPQIPIEEPTNYGFWFMWAVVALALIGLVTMVRRTLRARRADGVMHFNTQG